MRLALLVLGVFTVVACSDDGRTANAPPTRYRVGRPATREEVAARDIDVGADGEGLPPGTGTASQGEAVFAQKCASCHGANGEGKPPQYPRLVGRDPSAENFVFGKSPGATRTIGNYWPYATTVFDYVRRAMPQTAPGSLTNDEVYALTAYLLAANDVISKTGSLDAVTLRAVRMPYVDRFVPDTRRGGHDVK